MKLVVFGAAGPTGKEVVTQALAAGNEVVANVRNLSKLGIANEHLTLVQCELSDKAQIERAISN